MQRIQLGKTADSPRLRRRRVRLRRRWRNAGPSGNYNGLDTGDGLFYRVSYARKLRIRSIQDGTSNTFMAGEQLPEKNSHSDWPYFNHAQATCGIDMNATTISGAEFAYTNWENVFGFRGPHRGGINFAFADGSVRFIEQAIDQVTYRALASHSGGETVNAPQ